MDQDKILTLLTNMAESNDQASFKDIFDHYFPGLLSFAYSIVKDTQHAEEIVSDVFHKVWLNKTALPSIKNFTNYLYTATKNTALNYLSSKANIIRKNSILIEDLGNEFDTYYPTFTHTLINTENLASINQAINSLPPQCKLIFRLIKDEELKYSEVAQLLNISIKAVERQMTIALKKIVDILKYELEEYSTYFEKREKKG